MAEILSNYHKKPPIIMEFTHDEALFLRDVMGSILGDDVKSRRKYGNKIWAALKDGPFPFDQYDYANDKSGNISFGDIY